MKKLLSHVFLIKYINLIFFSQQINKEKSKLYHPKTFVKNQSASFDSLCKNDRPDTHQDWAPTSGNFHFKFDHAVWLQLLTFATQVPWSPIGLYLGPSIPGAYKAHQLYSSPRCSETLTVNSISENKRCSQFDALGNHVMKNRLLRIRISQALPHCIEFSRAEW